MSKIAVIIPVPFQALERSMMDMGGKSEEELFQEEIKRALEMSLSDVPLQSPGPESTDTVEPMEVDSVLSPLSAECIIPPQSSEENKTVSSSFVEFFCKNWRHSPNVEHSSNVEH